MIKLPQGDIFAAGAAVSGSKSTAAHCWKYCPYSTQITGYNSDSRVPEIEKTYHGETEGQMHSYSIGGPMGWVCADNDCAFYAGTATTEVTMHGRKFATASGITVKTADDMATLSGSVQHLTQGRHNSSSCFGKRSNREYL
jgi:hypothetical protein